MEYRGMSDVLDFFTSRERIFNFFDNRHMLDWLGDKSYLKLAFRAKMGYPLNLKNPITFSEKLQWLKLYDRNPLYTTLVDKYAVRRYIADKIGEEYLIPLVGGPWNSAEEIDFDALPEQFVLKCNHNSGGVIICRDKSSFDRAAAVKRLEEDLKKNYYLEGREWPYKNVKPCIIAEKYMEDENGELRDYKFFCFNGAAKMMFIASNRGSEQEETKFDFYDEKGTHLPFTNGHPNAAVLPELPVHMDDMLKLAETLSANMPQARIDFYEVGSQIYFGEITFFHWSGMKPFNPPEWDKTIGAWLELPGRI